MEDIKNNPYYLEEMAVVNAIPDGPAYYEHIIKKVDIDRSNPNNSYAMYIAGKVDVIDPTKPCNFVEGATSLPDIDTDFPTDYREIAIEYVKQKYGLSKVCQIATFGRLAGRSAIKAVLRAEGTYDYAIMNAITEKIPDEAAISDQLEEMDEPSIIMWVLENKPELVSDYCYLGPEGELAGDFADVFKEAIKLEGTLQNQGKHAAGLIIASEDIRDNAPLLRARDGSMIAAMDMGDLEKLGLVKFDFLGVDILNKIAAVMGVKILDIPLNDGPTWDMIGEGRTKGCFQIESHLGRGWAKELKPRNIEDTAGLVSIIRPGCVSGDTPVAVKSNYIRSGSNKKHIKYVPLRQIFNNKNRYDQLRSIDENYHIINNDMLDVFYTGQKECFKLKVRRYRKFLTKSYLGCDQYPLECTEDHELLTPTGWKQLKDIAIGERIAARKLSAHKAMRSETTANRHVPGMRVKNTVGLRNFQEICYKNYFEKCCVCGWDKANLDTNHIDENRHVDNSPENLCFLCPNHHREFTLGFLPKDELRKCQLDNRLPVSDDIEWITYEGCESVGVKDVYDISMAGPNHNFLAGNIVVHNCLLVTDDKGRNMAKVFCERKNGLEELSPDDPLTGTNETYNVIIYQETLLRIARDLAGFNSADAIKLMKSVGKKDAKLLFSLEEKFVSGCIKVGRVTKEQAVYIFGQIKKSARYLFNKSHAVGYSYPAYWSAYIKCHFPLQFYKEWMQCASHKLDPHLEMKQLMMSARIDGINIIPPSVKHLEPDFFIRGNSVHFGLSSVKAVSDKELDKLFALIKEKGGIDACTAEVFLLDIFHNVNKRTIENLIEVGGFDYTRWSRSKLKYYFECLRDLTDKERDWMIARLNTIKFDIRDELLFAARPKKDGGAAATSARVPKILAIVDRLKNPGRELHDIPSVIASREEQLTGATISVGHMDDCLAAGMADASCADFMNGKKGKYSLIVEIKEVKRHIIKQSGKEMAFLVVADDSCEIENVVCFADKFEMYSDILFQGNNVAIFGEVSSKGSFAIERAVTV